MHLPGGAISVAHQFLRCVLHQLAPNGVFLQMFQTHLNGTMVFTDFDCFMKRTIHLEDLFVFQNLRGCNSSKVSLRLYSTSTN